MAVCTTREHETLATLSSGDLASLPSPAVSHALKHWAFGITLAAFTLRRPHTHAWQRGQRTGSVPKAVPLQLPSLRGSEIPRQSVHVSGGLIWGNWSVLLAFVLRVPVQQIWVARLCEHAQNIVQDTVLINGRQGVGRQGAQAENGVHHHHSRVHCVFCVHYASG